MWSLVPSEVNAGSSVVDEYVAAVVPDMYCCGSEDRYSGADAGAVALWPLFEAENSPLEQVWRGRLGHVRRRSS